MKFGLEQHRQASATRSAIPNARSASGHHRRHQRQGIGHGDDRDGAARRRPPVARATPRPIWCGSKNASSSTDARSATGGARATRSAVVQTAREALIDARRARSAADVFRVHDRGGVRAVPRREGRASPCSRSASAAGSTPPTSSRRSPRPSSRSTSITRRSLATRSTSIAAEKAGIIKPGIPVVCGPLPAEAHAVIDERRACADRACARARSIRHADAALATSDRDRVAGDAAGAAPARTSWPTPPSRSRLLDDARRDRRSRLPIAAHARGPDARAAGPAGSNDSTVGGGADLLDAAHNPAGARALASYLREHGADGVDAGLRRDAGQGDRRRCSQRARAGGRA